MLGDNKMVRALGVDPGTKSFDIVVIEEDKVIAEKSIPTEDIAKDPDVLIRAVKELENVDIIAGPSGYGSPVICNKDIKDPRIFALEILLLTPKEQLEKGLKTRHAGIAVYKALADVVEDLWREKLNVCYIPSVILLPTVPVYRKINKIDMGTADKLAVAALAIYDYSSYHGTSYEDASFIVVEMGYGYNAVIGVKNGKVVDGLGGTLVSPGFLTAGSLDLEVAAAGGIWERTDVFTGGVSVACKTLSVEDALEKRSKEVLCNNAFEAMIEGIVKAVASVKLSVSNADEILLSGRLTRYPRIYKEIVSVLEKFGNVRKLRGLRGARIAKEAGQGYALIGNGLANGYFNELTEHLEIKKARGTTLDWLIHPRTEMFKKRIRNAFMRSLREPKRFL